MADLAALISLCAQLRADGLPGDGEAWAATAATLGGGESARLAWEPGDREASSRRSRATGAGWGKVAPMAPLGFLLPLAAKTAAEEGKLDVITAMLVVGLIFLGVIVLGELSR